MDNTQPHIILIVARGEAVRNFLYSDTLRTRQTDEADKIPTTWPLG